MNVSGAPNSGRHDTHTSCRPPMDCLMVLERFATHARQELLLLLPGAKRRRTDAARNHTRQSEIDLAGGRGRDAADRKRALADLTPPRDIAPVGRSSASRLLDRRPCLLAQPGCV